MLSRKTEILIAFPPSLPFYCWILFVLHILSSWFKYILVNKIDVPVFSKSPHRFFSDKTCLLTKYLFSLLLALCKGQLTAGWACGKCQRKQTEVRGTARLNRLADWLFVKCPKQQQTLTSFISWGRVGEVISKGWLKKMTILVKISPFLGIGVSIWTIYINLTELISFFCFVLSLVSCFWDRLSLRSSGYIGLTLPAPDSSEWQDDGQACATTWSGIPFWMLWIGFYYH